MIKRILTVLVVAALLVAPVLARPGTVSAVSSVTASANPASVNTATNLTVTFTLSGAVGTSSYVVIGLPSFQLPSSNISPAYISSTPNAGALTGIPSGGSIYLQSTVGFSATTYSVTISSSANVKTPTAANFYSITVGTYNPVSEVMGTASIAIGGGSGSGGLTITPSSTVASAFPVTLGIGFTPTTYPVSSMVLSLQGYTFLATLQASYISISSSNGGTSSTVSTVSGSASSLTVNFSTPLAAGYTYTLYFSSNCYLMNPTTANTYTVTATLYGAGTTLTGTVTVGGGGASVTSPTAQVSSTAPSTAASYTLSFATSATGALASGNTITIQFPSTTTFPSASGTVQIYSSGSTYGYGTYVVSGYTMTVTVYTAVANSTWVQLTFSSITNPSTTGTYYLTVWTSKDTTAVQSNAYYITGTSIASLGLTVDTKAQSAPVQVQVSFQTSASGTLQQNSGTITVDFPSNMTVPSSINRSLVTVNGTQAHSVSVLSGNVVTIVTPVAIAAYSSVTVVFAGNAGIYNPSTSGVTVTISVSTSADVAPVSTSYTTITSQITQPQVQLTSYGAGSVSGYTISFNTGVAGSLRANYDAISITFPTGTVLPTTINRDLVKVNNYPAYAVTPSGNRLNIIPAVNAAANSPIQVLIDKTANIKNPSVAGSYTLQAYTSVEVTPVSGATYSIANLPRTFIIVSPATADGLAGFYRTRPTVVLTATSSIDPTPVVYYSISGSAQQVYAAPFQLPDGNVTLTYYARDRQGNQEDAQTFTAKVDATAPAITITLPADGTVTGQATIGVQGRTEAGATLTVAGAAVPVSAQGEFQTQVTLRDGQQFIVFTATDVAGNVGQAQLNVTLDTTPPVLTITKPVMFSTVLTSVCEVAGKTEPGATVRIAGAAVSVNADGSFSFNVMLKEGENLIDITATDAVGNQRKTAIPVTYKARTVIHLQVGNKTAMVNDVKKTLQAAPVNVKGVVMVPLRFIGEAFGATVTWDPVFQIIDIELKGSSIRLQLGTNYASVAGKKVILQGIPVSIKGTTMVPIRFIAEAFGAQVIWNAPTQGIDITYPKP